MYFWRGGDSLAERVRALVLVGLNLRLLIGACLLGISDFLLEIGYTKHYFSLFPPFFFPYAGTDLFLRRWPRFAVLICDVRYLVMV